jgi:hypothetical protein
MLLPSMGLRSTQRKIPTIRDDEAALSADIIAFATKELESGRLPLLSVFGRKPTSMLPWNLGQGISGIGLPLLKVIVRRF